MKNRKGFTLVELFVTTAIIGVLATLGIANFANFKQNAIRSNVTSVGRNLLNALIVIDEVMPDPDAHLNTQYFAYVGTTGFNESAIGYTLNHIGLDDVDNGLLQSFAKNNIKWSVFSQKWWHPGWGGSGYNDKWNDHWIDVCSDEFTTGNGFFWFHPNSDWTIQSRVCNW